jgi:replication factor A1
LSASLEDIINKIQQKSKIPKEEIINKINAKKKELGGLITDEGAAYIIAKDLGINILEGEPIVQHKLQIRDLIPGMNSVSVTGVVKDIIPVKEFMKSDKRKGAVANITLVDKSGEIRTVLWDEKTKGISSGNIKPAKVIKIIRGYIKEGRDGKPELNVGQRSAILYPQDTGLENLNIEPSIITDFTNLTPNQSISNIIGMVTQIFTSSDFERSDGSIGRVMRVGFKGEKGATRLVLWDDLVSNFNDIKEGEIIQIKNTYIRENRSGEVEVHTSSNSSILKKPEKKVDIKEISPTQPIDIVDLTDQLYDANVIGKVLLIYEEKEFERADKTTGSVKSVIIRDTTGTIRVSFWDDKIKEIIKLKKGDIIQIKHGYTRGSDFGLNLNVGSKSEIVINPPKVSIKEPSIEKISKISEIQDGVFNISVVGRVRQKFDIKEFEKSDGSKGKVLSLILVDDTGSIRVVCWNDTVDKVNKIKLGDVLLIQSAYSRLGLNDTVEIHLGNLALLQINPPKIDISPLEQLSSQAVIKTYKRKNISDLNPQDQVEVLGTIVYVFSKNIVYPACPTCYKKAEKIEDTWVCNNCGDIEHIDYRMIFSVTIDDGSGTIRANLIGEAAEKLLDLTAEQAQNLIESGKEIEINSKLQSLVAKSFNFQGKVIFSDFSQDNELNVLNVKTIEPEREVKNLLDSFSK